MDKKELIHCIENLMSISQIANKYNTNVSRVRYWMDKYKLKTYRRKSKKYSKDNLISAVKKSSNFSEVCRIIGVNNRGGSYEIVRNRCKEYNIDTSHFSGKRQFGDDNPSRKRMKTTEEILSKNKKHRETHKALKRALLSTGLVYECSICSIKDWMGKEITLDVDHINGDWSNCLLENLRFICPNCHRQTRTFGNKNRKLGRSGDIA